MLPMEKICHPRADENLKTTFNTDCQKLRTMVFFDDLAFC